MAVIKSADDFWNRTVSPDPDESLRNISNPEQFFLSALGQGPIVQESIKLQNERSGIPFDAKSSVLDNYERQAVALRGAMPEKRRRIEEIPGVEYTRVGEDNRIIVGFRDKNGNLTESLMDPGGTDVGDFYDMTDDMLQIMAVAGAAVVTGGMSLLTQAGVMGIASYSAGRLSDELVVDMDARKHRGESTPDEDAILDGEKDFRETEKQYQLNSREELTQLSQSRRSLDALLEVLIPGAGFIGKKVAQKAFNPFNVKPG